MPLKKLKTQASMHLVGILYDRPQEIQFSFEIFVILMKNIKIKQIIVLVSYWFEISGILTSLPVTEKKMENCMLFIPVPNNATFCIALSYKVNKIH